MRFVAEMLGRAGVHALRCIKRMRIAQARAGQTAPGRAASLMRVNPRGIPMRHPAGVRMRSSRQSHATARNHMKKILSLCLAAFRRRAPVRRHEEEPDLVQRLREAGL
ncbi:hypothetical protein GmRootV59_55880 (plasmid) [Variovorax sp. V59]|uniref:hypothetical protein n=1 Tax=unclassified Variovorax TaxID=663243 RepID=UPI0019907342|nr:hypothetical protein [Variovorax sp. VRV01]MBD9666905.1 hypothetical protein [Variovorax sp. VRV01]